MPRSSPAPANADEQDCFTGWRHVLCSMTRAGAAKKIKRRANRRYRRTVRERLRAGDEL